MSPIELEAAEIAHERRLMRFGLLSQQTSLAWYRSQTAPTPAERRAAGIEYVELKEQLVAMEIEEDAPAHARHPLVVTKEVR